MMRSTRSKIWNPSLYFIFVALAIFSTKNSLALELHKGNLSKIDKISKKDPKRFYMIQIGTDWCEPCHNMREDLIKQPKDSTALGQSYYSLIEENDRNTYSVEAFLKKWHFAKKIGSYPTFLVFKNGRRVLTGSDWFLGTSLTKLSADLQKIKSSSKNK